MLLKDQIIKDVNTLTDLQLLNQLFEYIQIIKRTVRKVTPNQDSILKLAGSISDVEADEIRKTINDEFKIN